MLAPDIQHQSLRDDYRRGGPAAREARMALEAYYPLLRAVFPVEGEIETVDAYDQYLRDPALEWDIVVLRDRSDGRIIGGIQWQAIRRVGASWVDSLAWVEHIWLADQPGVRTYRSFRRLLATVEKHMRDKDVDVGFMEFNDPDKTTPEQMEEDAKGGLTTWDRLLLWARVGLCEVGYRAGGRWMPAPYAQPSMESGPPVRILTLGFFSFDRDLTEESMTPEDYLRILYRAHSTIRGLDPAADPTCLEYTAEVLALGVAAFEFTPLRCRFQSEGA